MATRLGTAYIPIEGDWSRFNRDLQARGNSLGVGFSKLGSDLGRKLSQGAATAAKVGLAGVGAGFVYAIKKAGDFESQLSSLSAVTSANATQMDRLRAQALKAGAATKFSALEAAQAQTELAKGGLSVEQIAKGGLTAALALAAAGELDLADAASTTVNAMKLFGLRGKGAMKVADGLATAANVTTADVNDFRLALAQAGSAAKTSGLNFQETVVALEALAEQGIKGSDAGTSLKTALLQLASPTSAAAVETTKQLGINVFDASGNMKSLVDVASELRQGLGGLTKQQRLQAATTLVGQDGFRALLALYDAGPQKIAKLERGLNKQGTAAQVAKTKQDNLKGSLEQLRGSVETLAISVGTEAIPTIRRLTDDVKGFANDVNRVLSRNDLTFGEKVNRIFDEAKVDAKPWIDKIGQAIDDANIPEHLAAALSAATPVLAKAAAQAGIVTAKTLASAFVDTSIWGKVVIGGLLLKRMGGIPAFTAVGRTAGTAMGAGAATGFATGAAGLGGKLKGILGGAGLLAKRLVALDVALNLVDARGNPIVTAINSAHDLTFGIIPKIKYPTSDERAKAQIDKVAGQIDRLTGQKDFRGLTNLSSHIRALADDARDFGNARLGRTWDQMAADAEAAAARTNAALGKQWIGQIESNFRALSRSGKVNMDAIRNTVRTNMQIVKDRLGADTLAGRRAVARNFRLAAKEIQTQMDAGVLSTKEGSRLIRVYLRKAREAMGLTRSQAEALQKTGTLLNSDDRPGRSTILAPTAKGATKAAKARTSDKKKAPADDTQKKTTKTVKARTGVSKIGNTDVDTLNVNRLIVAHADGITAKGGGGGGGATGVSGATGSASATEAQRAAQLAREKLRTRHAGDVAKAKKALSSVGVLGPVAKFEDVNVDTTALRDFMGGKTASEPKRRERTYGDVHINVQAPKRGDGMPDVVGWAVAAGRELRRRGG